MEEPRGESLPPDCNQPAGFRTPPISRATPQRPGSTPSEAATPGMALLGRASLLGRTKLRPRQEGGGFSHAQTPRPCPLVWDFPWSGVPLHEGLPHPRETGGARAQAARRLNDDRHGSWRRERPPILLLAVASLGCRRSERGLRKSPSQRKPRSRYRLFQSGHGQSGARAPGRADRPGSVRVEALR